VPEGEEGSSVMIDYQRYIVRDKHVCGGEPIIRGTRVTVRTEI